MQVVPHHLVAGLRESGTGTPGSALSMPSPPSTVLACTAFLSVFSATCAGNETDRCVGYTSTRIRRVTLQQRVGHGRQLVLVLVGVLARDHQARLVARVGIRARVRPGLEAGRRRRETAGPLGDRAVLVAGLLRADRCEGLAELARFLRRNRRQSRWRSQPRASPQSVSCESCWDSSSEGRLERQRDEVAIATRSRWCR